MFSCCRCFRFTSLISQEFYSKRPMMVLPLNFTGYMAPVFTPFDEKNNLNLQLIPQYAGHLSAMNIKGILVNGTVGEGVSMNTEERKAVAEAWVHATKSTGQSVMVHIGGTNFSDVLDMAKHAESLGVSSLLCVADLFFQPKTVEDLIDYLNDISAVAPKTPLLYYHIPSFTGINLNMREFLEKAYGKVPTLAGVKYTHNNLEEAYQCLKIHNGAYKVFLGNDHLILGGISMGINDFILTTLSFASSEIFQIDKLARSGQIAEALKIQKGIGEVASTLLSFTSWVSGFKSLTSSLIRINFGPVRSPLRPANKEKIAELASKWEAGALFQNQH